MLGFDKTHKKVVIGMGKDFLTKFRRDKEGNLDPTGNLGELWLTVLKVKFLDKLLLMLGVTLKDGDGVRLPLFKYTGKIILMSKDYQLQERDNKSNA